MTNGRWSSFITVEWTEKGPGDSFWRLRQFTGERKHLVFEIPDVVFYGFVFIALAVCSFMASPRP